MAGKPPPPPMREREYTVLFPFCGLGGGAIGFQQANAKLEGLGLSASFRVLGGIDIDPASCADFTYLTGAPALCADISKLTPTELMSFVGHIRPDVIFLSPPCVGFSGLLPEEKSRTKKYQLLNHLVVDWFKLMLKTWGDRPPRLILLENVPRIRKRGADLLRIVRRLLRKYGYKFHDSTHDCGELGGLAQHRKRFLLVARLEESVPKLLYQPSKLKLRACGEELSKLPLPGDPSAGPMHQLSSLSYLNCVRLAMIPPGGDWRDIDGVLADGQKRREGWGRYTTLNWAEPSCAVTGAGTNGAWGVGDVRVRTAFRGVYGLTGWEDPIGTVTGKARLDTGCFSVADPRVPRSFSGGYGLLGWGDSSGAITGEAYSSTGSFSVADPRVQKAHHGGYGMQIWDEPCGTITGGAGVTSGRFSIADARVPASQLVVPSCFEQGYGVLGWDDQVGTITGRATPTNGAFAIADPRTYTHALRLCGWDESVGTITSARSAQGGAPSVADVRVSYAYPHSYGVLPWSSPTYTIAGKAWAGCGAYAVSDPRIAGRYAMNWRVASWGRPVGCITGQTDIQAGAPSIADPRRGPAAAEAVSAAHGDPPAGPSAPPVLVVPPRRRRARNWQPRRGVRPSRPYPTHPRGVPGREQSSIPLTVDLSLPGLSVLPLRWHLLDAKERVPFPVILRTADGTWHRPLTTLELLVLQGLPAFVNGLPTVLWGASVSGWRERIGNAVPPPAARRIGVQILLTLLHSDTDTLDLSPNGGVWVRERLRAMWRTEVDGKARPVSDDRKMMAGFRRSVPTESVPGLSGSA